jgi:catechol 2,3-dioxygenase-like lactoylglutathione lyase family enzyme
MAIPLINALGGFSQVGMVVKDADATMRYLSETLGIGPFFVMREIMPDDFRFRGAPSAPPVLTLGFAQAGPVQIEVIQQHNDAPSAYLEFFAAGREGCQHLSIWLDDRDAYTRARGQLSQCGLSLIHETGEASWSRFAYFATEIPGGLMVEIAEARIPAVRAVFENVARAAVDWDGRDPIRMLG